MDYIDWKREKVSAWYDLDFLIPKTLVVKIHGAAMDYIGSLHWKQSFIAHAFRNDFELPPFLSTRTKFGFGGSLVFHRREGDWFLWRSELPWLNGGHGGKRAWALRGTLNLLFSALWTFHGDATSPLPQLLVVEMFSVEREMAGGSFSVTFTPTMRKWLASARRENFETAEEAMRLADRSMWTGKLNRSALYDFKVFCNSPGRIHLSVPGSACGLDPDFSYDPSGQGGYALLPHNIDSSFQQLTLLAGVAKLNRLARESALMRE